MWVIGEREIGNQNQVCVCESGVIWDFGSVVRSWGLLVLLCPVGWVGVWSGSVSRRGARVGAEGGALGFSCEGDVV